MAHFAKLDENNQVMQVIVVHNNEILENGIEVEQKGIDFCKSLFGLETNWRQCSYNSSIRKRYPGVGFTFREDLDAFLAPKPFPSWELDEQTLEWSSPIARPDTTNNYVWDEPTLSWVPIDQAL